MGAIELPDDATDCEEADTTGNSTLGFAGEQASEDQTQTTLLHRVPPKHLAISAYVFGVLTAALAVIATAFLF